MNLLTKGIKLLPKNNQNKLWTISILQTLKFILEIFSIGPLIPLIYFFAKGEDQLIGIIKDNKFFSYIPEIFYSKDIFLISLISIIILFFFIKLIFIIFASYYEQKWLEGLNVVLSSNLFGSYLYDTSDFFLQKSHEKIRNITSEINIFCKFFVKSVVLGMTEVFKLLGMIIFLFFFNPIILIAGLVVSIIIFLLIFKIFKKKLEFYGKKRLINASYLLKYVTEGLNSLKEIILSKNINYFIKKFENHAHDNANINTKYSIINIIPKQGIEFLAISLICILLFFLSNENSENSDLIFKIGIYITIFSRILPTTNQIQLSIQNILFSKSSIQTLEQEFSTFNNNKTVNEFRDINKSDISKIDKINFLNVFFRHNKQKDNILEDINFELEKGKIYCFTGDSGSGKSTIANLIMGFLKPTTGEIVFNDNMPISERIDAWQINISYLSQNIFLLNENLKKNIAFGVEEEKIDTLKVKDALEKVNLLSYFESNRNGIDTEVGEDGSMLSGGQKQRLAIARNLYLDKKILILDEFTSSLDVKNENYIFEMLKKNNQNKIIITITHSNNIIKQCDKAYLIENKILKKIK